MASHEDASLDGSEVRKFARIEWDGGSSKRGIVEKITASASAESHFIDISLVYRKAFAHLQTEFAIDAAKSFPL